MGAPPAAPGHKGNVLSPHPANIKTPRVRNWPTFRIGRPNLAVPAALALQAA